MGKWEEETKLRVFTNDPVGFFWRWVDYGALPFAMFHRTKTPLFSATRKRRRSLFLGVVPRKILCIHDPYRYFLNWGRPLMSIIHDWPNTRQQQTSDRSNDTKRGCGSNLYEEWRFVQHAEI
jgi:hypothetical protein